MSDSITERTSAAAVAQVRPHRWQAGPEDRSTVAAPWRPFGETEPRVAVLIASRGRPALLAEAVATLRQQTLQPTRTIVCYPTTADAGVIADDPAVTLVTGPVGSSAQRNAALRHVPRGTDVVVFFDDDFLPRHDWIATVATLIEQHPDLGAVTGTLVADGAKGPGLSFATARRLLADAEPASPAGLRESYVPYGCNMAFRASAIAGRSFDERLVLYGWLEDRDFGAALERRGYRVVRTSEALGVHLGTKSGRVSGRRFGYSQIVNPLYLLRKGTMPWRAVADHLFRNLAINLVRSLKPEPFIDRRGRLRGNFQALGHVLRGVIEPERAADL